MLTLQTNINAAVSRFPAHLSCNATGANSSITWKRNNRNYSTVDMIDMIVTTYVHEGNYTCVASNDVGISSSNTVIVIQGSELIYSFSHIMAPFKKVVGDEDQYKASYSTGIYHGYNHDM